MTSHLAAGQRAVITEYGHTPLDAVEHHLTFEPQPVPDLSRLAPGDLIIKVESAAVGWVDLLMSSGQYQHMARPPYTPGLEYSGTVVAVGDGVAPDKIKIGDRVLNDGFVTGPRSQGAYQRYGGFATYAVAPQTGVLKLPEAFSFDQGCNLLGNYETAYYCLVTCGQIQPGETVLIHGASGSTGLAAVHIACLMGATVIATGRSPEKLAQVKAHGAHHTVCTSEHPRFREQVKALTDGKGVDMVYDGVGGDVSLESLRCVTFGARFLIVGWASTPFVAKGKGQRGAPGANVLPTNLIMMKGLKVLGCPTVISTHHNPALRPARLKQLMAWADEGRLSPCVVQSFPMSQLKEAMLAKWESRFVGGCTVHP